MYIFYMLVYKFFVESLLTEFGFSKTVLFSKARNLASWCLALTPFCLKNFEDYNLATVEFFVCFKEICAVAEL